MKAGFILLLLIATSLQCEDRGGADFCKHTLLEKDNMCDNLSATELAECLKTCKACPKTPTPSSQGNRPPFWAIAPPTPRQPQRPNRIPKRSDDEDPLALPLYAVIIIVIAVLVIFIGITVCVIKLKHKWKKRRANKNRRLLRNAPPPMNTMQPNYLWGSGSYNSGYQPEMDGWSRNMYLPGDGGGHQAQAQSLNNAASPDARRGKKNINILQNGTKDKRKAPDPPQENTEESAYQNLRQVNNNKPEGNGKSKAPAPPPSHDVAQNAVQEIPVRYSESVFSDAPLQQEQIQKSGAPESKNFGSWNMSEPPILPPRAPAGDDQSTEKRNFSARNPNVYVEGHSNDDGRDDDSDTCTLRSERTLSELTEDTQHAAPDLSNILNEWKEHLQEQKKELEDYYKNLHNYVKRLGLKPAGDEWRKLPHSEKNQRQRNRSEPAAYSDRQYASIHENYSGIPKFPEPPESVRGDFTWEPNDETSQKQVIVDLKKKLARLQNLLESTQEVADSEKKSSAYYMPSQHSRPPKYQDKTPFFADRVTIKALLQQLEERERLKVQMRIAQALDTAKRRGGMSIGTCDGPITCLSKQIHHVMNDILDPRTSTKIELGAHAACTLTNKLLSNVHTNLLPVLREETPKQSVSRTSDRISILTKQLLDMTKQLMARQKSFRSKDYGVFINAFVDTTEKILDATFHLVCVIVDLQKAERRGMIKPTSVTAPMRSFQRQSLPPQRKQEKDQLLSRLHSESNSTSLSAVDVRRLNEDLAKLRQLLNTETQIPTFSDITAPRNPPQYPENIDLGLEYGEENSDCDTMSTLSCSTCMPEADDAYFYSEDFPLPLLYQDEAKLPAPPLNQKPKPTGKVQYTEILFDQEGHRPSRRPKRGFGNSITLPQEAVERPKPFSGVSDHVSQVESTKESQGKASTLEPSSFASFHTENEMRGEMQPRHQAMLARYFGGDTLQPKTEPKKSKEYLRDSLPDHIVSAAAAMPLVGADFDGPCPMVTMLPCGLVANDTPPIINPPQEKRVKLTNIPEITVLRNGTEEERPGPKKEPQSEIDVRSPTKHDQDSDSTSITEQPDSQSFYATDTLPMHDKGKFEVNDEITPDKCEETRPDVKSPSCESLSDGFDSDMKRTLLAFEENEFADDGSEEAELGDVDGRTDITDENKEQYNHSDDCSSVDSSNSSSSSSDDSVETTQLKSHSNTPSFENQTEEGMDTDNAQLDSDNDAADEYNDGLISEFEFPRVVSHMGNTEEERLPFSNRVDSMTSPDPSPEAQNGPDTVTEPIESDTDKDGDSKETDPKSENEDFTNDIPDDDVENAAKHDGDNGNGDDEIKHDLASPDQTIESGDDSSPSSDDDVDVGVEDDAQKRESIVTDSDGDREQSRKSKDKKFSFKVPNIFGKKNK